MELWGAPHVGVLIIVAIFYKLAHFYSIILKFWHFGTTLGLLHTR